MPVTFTLGALTLTYRDTITACPDQHVGNAVVGALDLLFRNDGNLLSVNASEQAIAARFAGYLAALPGKLRAWQEPRGIDFGSLSQADPAILIGGLDFEH